MKPCMHLVELSIFFNKSCHCQTYQNYEQRPQIHQNSYFQSHFSVLKISRFFCPGDQLLLKNVFEDLDLLDTLFSKIVPNFCPLCS